MIKKLRIKLVAVAMFSLFLVLLAVMAAVNVLNYRGIVEDADEILAVLEENRGSFPKMGEQFPGMKRPPNMSPEIPFETRYFSVLLGQTGRVISTDTGKIAAVDTESAMAYARNVWEEGSSRGFVGEYRYVCHAEGNMVRIIFLDCGRNLATFRTFLFASCGISAVGLLAVFLLVTLFSGRIIKPVSESYEKQKQFITDAGHEIKTPVSIIDADAEVLAMELGENEWLRDIQLQAKRLAALTNDLIYLSRMEEEQVRMQMIELPFSDLAEETAQSFQALAITQNKQFTTRIQPMISLRGDEKALRQLLTILLDNGLKYSPAEGSITLTLEQQGKQIRLSVENSAEAVSRETLEHMFDRFYRGDKSRNSQTGGYGIGLSIAKAVVEAHKGKIGAASRDGHSLLVTVTLPG